MVNYFYVFYKSRTPEPVACCTDPYLVYMYKETYFYIKVMYIFLVYIKKHIFSIK